MFFSGISLLSDFEDCQKDASGCSVAKCTGELSDFRAPIFLKRLEWRTGCIFGHLLPELLFIVVSTNVCIGKKVEDKVLLYERGIVFWAEKSGADWELCSIPPKVSSV